MIFHFCPDLKSLFTVAAISRVQTEVAFIILSGSEACTHVYKQVQGQISPIVCLFILQPHQVLFWVYCSHFFSSWSLRPVSLSIEIFVYLKWSRNKHQSKLIPRILRLFKQRKKMQSRNLTSDHTWTAV